jgi:hypothetical protein
MREVRWFVLKVERGGLLGFGVQGGKLDFEDSKMDFFS